MGTKKLFIVLSVLLSLIIITSSAYAAPNSYPLINVEDLYQIVDDPGTIIIDVSSPAEYQNGHIPGAMNISTTQIVDPNNTVKMLLAPPEQIEDLLSSLGIRNDSSIVIYARTPFNATRLYWTLQVYGHQDLRLLDGNLSNWQAAGYEVSTETPAPTSSTYTIDRDSINYSLIADTSQTYAAMLSEDTVLIDARSSNEYYNGHIPGAINVFRDEHLDSNGQFKTIDELRKLYQGITPDKDIIVYCQTGFQGSLNYFVLTSLLDYQNVKNYDASLNGWSNNELTKSYIEKGCTISDLLFIAANIGLPTTNFEAYKADINKDTQVNILDLLMAAQYINS